MSKVIKIEYRGFFIHVMSIQRHGFEQWAYGVRKRGCLFENYAISWSEQGAISDAKKEINRKAS